MDSATVWNSGWAWSILLILSTVIIHVIGLGLFNVKMVQVLTVARGRPHFIYAFALGTGGTAIWAICLHSIEAGQRPIDFPVHCLTAKQRYYIRSAPSQLTVTRKFSG